MNIYHYIGEGSLRGKPILLNFEGIAVHCHETEKFLVDEFYIPDQGIISYFKNGLQLLEDGTKIYTEFNDHYKAIEEAQRRINEKKFIREYNLGELTIIELVMHGKGHAEFRTVNYPEWIPKAVEFNNVARPIIETLLQSR